MTTDHIGAHRPAPDAPGSDTGSLPFALFISLMCVTLTALLMPVVLLQIGSSRVEARRVESLQAAQTGMNVVMAQIRAATNGAGADGNPLGDVTKLPCGSLAGDLGAGSAAHYRVTIDYFSADPSPADYLDTHGDYIDSWINSHSLVCRTGVPTTALIRSQGISDNQTLTGSCTADARCLRATYTFAATNQNIAGSLIHVYKTPTSTDLCLAAGSGPLTADHLTTTALTVDGCDAADAMQIFSYNSDLTISLAASRTSDLPDGMCLDSRAASGLAVEFEPCDSDDLVTQRWVYTSGAAFVASDGTCMKVFSPDQSGSTVVHDNSQCGAGAYSNVADFSPESGVGVGAAGWSTGQLADNGQYARCLTVARSDYLWHTGSGNPALNDGPYLTSETCDQTAPVQWKQTWVMPGPIVSGPGGVTGLITINAPNSDPPEGSPAGRYCLQSPASALALRFAKIVTCPAGPPAPAHTTWTITGYTGDYQTSYVIRDDSTPALCLAPQTPAAMAADPYPFPDGADISKIVVQTCDGSALQKWNVSAGTSSRSPVGRFGEK